MLTSILRNRRYIRVPDRHEPIGTRWFAPSTPPEEEYTLEPFPLLLPSEEENQKKTPENIPEKATHSSDDTEGELCHKHSRICTVCKTNECSIL